MNAQRYFHIRPNAEKAWQTIDGMIHAKRKTAELHAKGLDDKKVVVLKREENQVEKDSAGMSM